MNNQEFNSIVDDLKAKISEVSTETPLEEKEKIKPELQEDDLRIIASFISYPYDLLAENIDNDFKLTEIEKDINTQLAYLVIIYYIPYVNIGKLSIILLVLFNISLIAVKIMKVIKKRQAEKQIEKVERNIELRPIVDIISEEKEESKQEIEPKQEIKEKRKKKEEKKENEKKDK